MPNKPEKPPIAFFAAQFNALLVGPGKMFPNFDDLCRYAAGDLGITGVSLHTGMLDVKRMIRDDSYRGEVVAHYKKLGTPIIRLESHVTGQRVCMHPAVAPRFRGFAPVWAQHLNHDGLETQAADEMKEAITLSSLMGLKHHATFPGGRTNPVLSDPWNAHPPLLREKALAHLALKWEDILAQAGKSGVRVGFEIGHIMEDLFNIHDLLEWRDRFLFNSHAKLAVDWNLDVSHWELEDDDPELDVSLAITSQIGDMGHAKQAFYNRDQSWGRRRPSNLPWNDRAGKFCTYGIKNPRNSMLWMKAMLAAHDRLEHGTHLVIEGECMFLRHPIQAMGTAAKNLRLVLEGKEPIPFEEITPLDWNGPAFDQFADSGYTAEAAMQLNFQDSDKLQERLEAAGVTQ